MRLGSVNALRKLLFRDGGRPGEDWFPRRDCVESGEQPDRAATAALATETKREADMKPIGQTGGRAARASATFAAFIGLLTLPALAQSPSGIPGVVAPGVEADAGPGD